MLTAQMIAIIIILAGLFSKVFVLQKWNLSKQIKDIVYVVTKISVKKLRRRKERKSLMSP